MSAGGYESWFVSARDPESPRALWIRHTRHRPRQGRESVALWCTVVDRDQGQPPVVVKEVFTAFPAVLYRAPRGGTRTVRHAALAGVELVLHRPGHRDLTLASRRGAYEYGTREPMPGIAPRPLPEG